MTPPCIRCHGAPHTSSLPEGWDRPGARLPDCAAESRWPSNLETLATDRPLLESWVRSNYERARERPRPFRFDIGAARFRADLRARPLAQDSPPWPGSWSPYHPLSVAGSAARLRSDLEISGNALQLGLRELVSIEGLTLDGPASLNIWSPSLRVGNFGALHFIARTTPTVLLIDPFMAPRPPIGYDMPTGNQWAECEAGNASGGMDAGFASCVTPMVYPNHRADPRIDLDITSNVPREFLDANGRLPIAYDLQTLLDNFAAFFRNRPAPADSTAPRRDWLALVEEYLGAGSHIELDIAQLNDFFIPGVLDLGPSRGTFRVSYAGGRRFTGVAENFEIQLDPSGYPASANGEPSLVEIQTAYLSAAGSPVILDGVEAPPGLRFDYDAERGELWVEGNVSLHSDLTLPMLGAVELSGSLALRSAWRLRDGEWQAVPGTTHLQWRDGELWQAGGRRPLLTRFSIDLSDVFDSLDPFAVDPQGLRLQAQGFVGAAGYFSTELSVPIARDLSGHYDFQSLLADPLRLAMQVFVGPGEGYGGVIVQDAELQAEISRSGDGAYQAGAELSAERFAALGLDLRNLRANVGVEGLRYGDGSVEGRIPVCRVAVNSHGSAEGLLRGSSSIELLRPNGHSMYASYDFRRRLLAINDLDFRLSAQGIHLPPRAWATLRRMVDPAVAALGLDGHLRGSLFADFRNWRMSGPIGLRGDRDGDVYFLDSTGRRVGPALIRDTRWNFRRVDRINWARAYALGDFHLSTLVNPSALLPHRAVSAPEETPVYDQRGRRLRPLELQAGMPTYNNQPWSLTGLRNRIVDYLMTLCRHDARCREESR